MGSGGHFEVTSSFSMLEVQGQNCSLTSLHSSCWVGGKVFLERMEPLDSLSWFSHQKNRRQEKNDICSSLSSKLKKDHVHWLLDLELCSLSSGLNMMNGPDFICPLTSLLIKMQQGIRPQIQALLSIQNLSRFKKLQRAGTLLHPKLRPRI